MFDKNNGLNSIENVEESGLREVLTFLSWETATSSYEMEYRKEMERKEKYKNGGMSH